MRHGQVRPEAASSPIGYHGPSRERSEDRRRYIYLLWFGDGTCYVGQSVDPKRRAQQHKRAWHRPFSLTIVGSYRGTYADMETWEHAWRVRAQLARVQVWAAPGLLIPCVQADPAVRRLGQMLSWPRLARPPGKIAPSKTPRKGR